MQYLLKFLAAFIQLVTLGRLRSSRPVEGDSLTMGLGGMLWWGYKFYGHPIREPEKDSHIREYFSAHPTAGFAQTGWGERQGRNSSSASTNTPLPTMATLTFAGDVLPAQAMRADCTEHYWDELDDFLHADICCCNLESPVVKDRPLSCASENITAPPRMNNTPEAVRLFADAGFSLFSTANNHALDQGVHGLLATLDFLDEVGLGHVGTARSRAEHDAFPIREVQGIKIAFLSWTFSLNRQTRPGGREFLANVLRLNAPTADITPVVAQVKQARARGAEVVVACLHWGLEYECFPTLHQMETAHRLIRAGVDIIVGNHPHGLQPAERYTWHDEDGREREGLILYALGDLMCQLPQVAFSALGALARVQLMRCSDDSVAIHSVELKPYYAYRRNGEKGTCVDARLLDFRSLEKRIAAGEFESDPELNPAQVKALRKLSPVLEDILPRT